MLNILTNLLKEKFAKHRYVCFASIYASTAAKSYILNYMWTAANFIIEGRGLCTVELQHNLFASFNFRACFQIFLHKSFDDVSVVSLSH